jgi:hypothetical protein
MSSMTQREHCNNYDLDRSETAPREVVIMTALRRRMGTLLPEAFEAFAAGVERPNH